MFLSNLKSRVGRSSSTARVDSQRKGATVMLMTLQRKLVGIRLVALELLKTYTRNTIISKKASLERPEDIHARILAASINRVIKDRCKRPIFLKLKEHRLSITTQQQHLEGLLLAQGVRQLHLFANDKKRRFVSLAWSILKKAAA